MGSLILKRGTKPQRTPEQMAELAALDNMSDEDIDYRQRAVKASTAQNTCKK